MKFALSLGLTNPSIWIELTEAADRLGYESMWLPEHLVLPAAMDGSPHAGEDHPPVPPHLPIYDVFSYLSFLAARTEQIRFGTQVYNIGLRHPFVVARGAATVDQLSGGRFLFGIGASWLRAEWDAVGLDFDTRGRRVDEAIDVCRRLWTDEIIEHHGEFFDFDPVAFEPKPIQTPLPLHIGGDGPAAIRRAATVGAGWIPMNHSLDELPAAVARLNEQAERVGRTDTVEVTVGGTVESDADVERYAAAGVTRLIVTPWQRTSGALAGIAEFAEQFL